MSSADDYGFAERLLHRAAFSTPFIHSTLSDLETDLYKKAIARCESSHEVFVTGLPRAGTTLLLDFLYGTGEFCTYTYRHMPFIRAPLLWQRLSRPFQKTAQAKERAHGDGMQVSFESPEAFEEIIWLHCCGKKYLHDDRQSVLAPEQLGDEAREQIRLSVRKLLLSDSEDPDKPRRYLSKNNSNIGRLDSLSAVFSTAKVVVAMREPLAHATSSLHQHRRFSAQHEDDEFSRQYMKWLGHYDFGANFRPIDFDQWLASRRHESFDDLNFWLEYWIAAYRHVARSRDDNLIVVKYEQLRARPEATLRALSSALGLKRPQRLIDCASRIRAPTSNVPDDSACDAALLSSARDLYAAAADIAS